MPQNNKEKPNIRFNLFIESVYQFGSATAGCEPRKASGKMGSKLYI